MGPWRRPRSASTGAPRSVRIPAPVRVTAVRAGSRADISTTSGTGGGFCYNVGRGIGDLFPGIIGFLAEAIGLGGAVAFGVSGYVLALVALIFLPETHGRQLHAAE